MKNILSAAAIPGVTAIVAVLTSAQGGPSPGSVDKDAAPVSPGAPALL